MMTTHFVEQSKRRQQGFTLLEMLIAIAIFAALSLAAYQVLQGVLTSDELAKREEAQLTSLQRAFMLLESDISQMVARSGRIDGESNQLLLAAALYGQESDDWGMAFMRGGWLNPDAMLPRSQLQRVGWRLKDNTLERLTFLYPDPVIGAKPRIQAVLTGVSGFRLFFFNKDEWQDKWPDRNVLPYGLAVELEVESLGMLRRQFMIGAGGQRGAQDGS